MRTLYPSFSNLPLCIVALLVCLILSFPVHAQVGSGNFIIANQTDLDNFTDGGTKYTSITGNLTIEPDGSGPFTDFSNLDELSAISGVLTIENYSSNQTNPDPLSEFDVLNSVEELVIVDNSGIESITSTSLTEIMLGNLEIINNDDLGLNAGTLTLDNLISIAGDLVLRRNENISDVSFGSLTTITGDLDLTLNDGIVSLDGFATISQLDGSVILVNNGSLSNVRQLGNTSGARLDIQNLEVISNGSLVSLGGTGSDAFRLRVQNDLIIRSNAQLTTVSDNIEVGIAGGDVNLGLIRISGNPNLTSIQPIFDKGHSIVVTTYDLNNNAALQGSFGGQAIQVTNEIEIQDNPLITDLPRFAAATRPTTTLAGDLQIARNPRLTTTVTSTDGTAGFGLTRLTSVGGGVLVQDNDDLVNLGMFRSLTNAGSITISNNGSVTNLDDFQAASLVINAFFSIINNASLANCCEPFCQTTVNGAQMDGFNNAVTINGNTGECADKQTAVNTCADEPDKGCLAAAPVEWLAFTGSLGTGSIDLEFSTATESDNDYFQIERSVAGGAFEAIGQIDGAGDSQAAQYYSFSDHDYSSGLNYYRIRQVDFDGTEAFSDVIVVDAGGSKLALTMFPNPASGSNVTLQLGSDWNAEKVTAQIYSVSGQFVREVRATGNSRLFLPTADLQAGMYAVRVSDGGRTVTTRLTVR